MSKKKWIFVVAPFGLALFIALGGTVVMLLWNWLVPGLFGWQQITFWQSLALLALCRILIGGFPSGHAGGGSIRRRMRERWDHMTPEERERMRQRFREHWPGDNTPPDPKTT